MKRTTLLRRLLLLWLALLCIGGMAQSPPDFDIAAASMKFPHRYGLWKFQTSAGFSMVKPPFDLVENAIQAPLVNIHATFGMPVGFSLEGDITTILVSNQFALGPRWNFRSRNFSFNLGYDIAFVYGRMNIAGFHNSAKAWIQYPNLSVGCRIKDITLTAKGELVAILWSSSKSGENEINHTTRYFNGGTCALYIEQRLWKNTVFIIGLKDNIVKYYWPTWMLFSTFDRYYHIPEIYFGWVL
jgi:hypothetical protein